MHPFKFHHTDTAREESHTVPAASIGENSRTTFEDWEKEKAAMQLALASIHDRAFKAEDALESTEKALE